MKFPTKTPNYIRDVLADFLPNDVLEVVDFALAYYHDDDDVNNWQYKWITFIDKDGRKQHWEECYN